MRPNARREGLRKRASFSKATPRCPARERHFPQGFGERAEAEIAAGFRQLWPSFQLMETRSEPLGAPVIAVPVTAASAFAPVHAALHPTMPPALAAQPLCPVRQERKTALLAFVERLVE